MKIESLRKTVANPFIFKWLLLSALPKIFLVLFMEYFLTFRIHHSKIQKRECIPKCKITFQIDYFEKQNGSAGGNNFFKTCPSIGPGIELTLHLVLVPRERTHLGLFMGEKCSATSTNGCWLLFFLFQWQVGKVIRKNVCSNISFSSTT